MREKAGSKGVEKLSRAAKYRHWLRRQDLANALLADERANPECDG